METSHPSSTAPAPTPVETMLAQMRNGTQETYEIRMRAAKIIVRVLTCDEVNAIRNEAKKIAALRGGDGVDVDLETQKNTLKLATQIPKNMPPILSDKLLATLSVDEICFLYDEYIGVLDRVNPSVEHVTPDQFRALVDGLKKKAITTNDLSIRQLKAICTAYVDLIQRQDEPK